MDSSSLNSQPLLPETTGEAKQPPPPRRCRTNALVFSLSAFVAIVVGLVLLLPRGPSAPLIPRNWEAVASSADGSKLIALDREQVFVSGDGGSSWETSFSLPSDHLRGLGGGGVASSADGTSLAVAFLDALYSSADSGATWIRRTPCNGYCSWAAASSSADGTRFIAVGASAIFTSANSGHNWTERGPANWSPSSCCWWGTASSADGAKLVVAALGGAPSRTNNLFTSTDFGVTWVARGSPHNWQSVASSADGSRLVACTTPDYQERCCSQIFTSADSGATWIQRGSAHNFTSAVASSADGSTLIAVSAGDGISISRDYGATWVLSGPPRQWVDVATSADGQKLLAAALYDQLYTSSDFGATWKAVF